MTYDFGMDEKLSPAPGRRTFSAEAVIGWGITMASTGILFLLLGWAQSMRQVPDAALVLAIIGAVFFVVGLIITLAGRSRGRR